MIKTQLTGYCIVILLALIFAVTYISFVQLMPSNELHYASIGWQMFVKHQYILPLQSGVPYPEKPPMLFWLMSILWTLAGPSQFITRLFVISFYLFSIILTAKIAKTLFPSNRAIETLSMWVLMSGATWISHFPHLRFESLLTFFTLLSIYSYLKYLQKGRLIYILIMTLSVASGLLTKGPVIFIYLLPFLIFFKNSNAVIFIKDKRPLLPVYASLFVAMLIMLMWVIWSSKLGGKAYMYRLVFGNTIGRTSGLSGSGYNFSKLPYYFYSLPAFIFPSSIFFLASLKKKTFSSPISKKLLYISLSILIIFSLISQKGDRYLIPLFPILSILIASVIVQSDRLKIFKIISVIILALLSILGASLNILMGQFGIVAALHLHVIITILSLIGIACSYFCYKIQDTHILSYFFPTYTALLTSFFTLTYIAISPYGDFLPLAKKISQLQLLGYYVSDIERESQLEYLGHLKTPIHLLMNESDNSKMKHQHEKYCVLKPNKIKHPKKKYYVLTCYHDSNQILEKIYPQKISNILKQQKI